MHEFLASKTWAVLFSLESFYKAAQWEIKHQGESSIATRDYWSQLTKALPLVKEACHALELVKSLDRLNHFQISTATGTVLNTVIVTELFGLRMSFINEIGERKFAFIPTEKVQFFEKDNLFGQRVARNFPAAEKEIKDAGNCLAADLDTAAVFHSIRAAEYGLRALAKHVKVKIKLPLEYADWGTITKAIQTKLDALEQKHRGKKKSEELEFYRIALSECNTLRDVWRNNVMHTRGRYNWNEALGVYSHVCDFMQRLATKLKE